MKIVIVNGSPRRGNTYHAIKALELGASTHHEVEIIEANRLDIKGCQGCGYCECYKGCVSKDDTNPTVDKLVEADMVIFATPVYWWGMSAQLKLVIDKCYSKGALLKNKKIGLMITGGSPVEAIQYKLINEQFDMMAQYLNWDILFSRSFYANGKNEIKENTAVLEELQELGKTL